MTTMISFNRTGVFFLVFTISLAVASAGPVDFVRDVQPIFQKHCYKCHGAKKQKSELRLDIKERAFKGGDAHGQAIIPGVARESPLTLLVTSEDKDERMPSEGKPLSIAEMKMLIEWIDQGAVWPDGVDPATN